MDSEFMESLTDKELIEELASRHDELIVIRPKVTNVKTDIKLVVFCKTKEDGYDIFVAVELLHDAQVGLMTDSLEVSGNGN